MLYSKQTEKTNIAIEANVIFFHLLLPIFAMLHGAQSAVFLPSYKCQPVPPFFGVSQKPRSRAAHNETLG